jgi:flagellar FliL protein
MARPTPTSAPAQAAPKSAKPKGRKLWLVLLGALGLAGAVGAGAWYVTFQREASAAQAPKPKPPVFIALEPFTVNLQPGGDAQYLQTTVVLRTTEPDTETAIKAHMPVVRDRILRVLSSQRGEALLSAEGKEKLAAEIAAAVTTPFDGERPQAVDAVLFTSFVIQ